MACFGSWDAARLETLGSALRERVTLRPDGFAGLPDDDAFWSDIARQCNQQGKSTKTDRGSSAPQVVPLTRVPSNELCACTFVELDSLDCSLVRPGEHRGLYLSDMSSAQSRLMHTILGTEQVILVGGSKAFGCLSAGDRRPLSAGSIFWIDAAQPLALQLVDAARFANQAPTVVASPDGRGVGAVICAAIIAAREGMSSVAALREVEKRRGPLRVEIDHMEELDNFCQRLLLAEFDLRLGVPPASPRQHEEAKLVKVKLSGAASLAELADSSNPSTPRATAALPQEEARSPFKSGKAKLEDSPARGAKRKRSRKSTPELDEWRLH